MTDDEALDNTIRLCCKSAEEAEKAGLTHTAYGHRKLAGWLSELRENRRKPINCPMVGKCGIIEGTNR